MSEIVRDRRLSRIRRLSTVGDSPLSETLHVGDCPRALNESVIGGCPKDLIYKKQKAFCFG